MMLGSVSNLVFINPWILAGLIFLPALWFLLRVTPPSPKRIRFPAARFLAGLQADDHTNSRTPWWILLLRLMTAALVIIALARPLLNPSEALPGHGAIRIVIDNGWASAQTWQLQNDEAAALIARAGREKRDIYILTTTPEPGTEMPSQYGPMAQGQAEGILSGLKPLPWPSVYDAAAVLAKETKTATSITSFLLGNGIQDTNPENLVQALRNGGELHIFQPNESHIPIMLKSLPYAGADLKAAISVPPSIAKGVPITLHALGTDGKILDVQQRNVSEPGKTIEVVFDLPPVLRQQVAQIRLSGRQGAGAVLMLDDTLSRRSVGIVSTTGADENAPLIDESYYLKRALEPYADLNEGTIKELLERKPAVMILPDIGALSADDLNILETWVRKGGLLLRFAGPHMTQGEAFLTPVPLLKGGRALDGALTWEKPPHMAAFSTTSPYYGFDVPPDITVNRQMLAEPVEGLDSLVWATLEDGTPLITAKELDRGILVLIHTTATPQWSDFAMSGLFVKVLQRTVGMAGKSVTTDTKAGSLQPLMVMDGFGRLKQPSGFVQPIASDEFEMAKPSSIHPPGIYGRSGYQKSLNLGDRIPALYSFTKAQGGVGELTYDGGRETELMPYLLAGAFILFLADWLIMILLQAGFYTYSIRRQAMTTAVFLTFLISCPSPSQADTSQNAIEYAGELHLAYIKSGITQVDLTTQNGLESLVNVLEQRTSVEPAGVVALDPDSDDLTFFPVIYWPVVPTQNELTPQAIRNIQSYLNHGGTIFFDTRDRQSTPGSWPGSSAGGASAQAIRRITASLDIPPLITMPDDHVLTRSFYLMQDFPGRYDGGSIWVEENSASGRDGVSSVIIGNHDWAAAWAAANTGRPRLGGGPQQGEMALRFGVNVVMYALTGNYKADQVHLPHILERLGQ